MDTDALTPLVLQNAAILRCLFATNGQHTPTDIARALGRDQSNVGKSLKALEKEGLVHKQGEIGWFATYDGAQALKALDRANGVRAESLVDTSGLVGLRWDQLVSDPLNPRKDFDPEELDGLRQSILQDGLLQNLVVRPAENAADQPMHRIVAGERRWRAIGEAVRDGDWPEDRLIPCKIVAIDDARHTELALIENLRRKDLKPLEEARGFKVLRDVHQLTTEAIAEKISMTQRFVQQRLQLLELDDQDMKFLEAGQISVEEARRRASQPKPKPVTFSEAELLVMAELQHKWKHAPKRKGDYDVQTEIAPNCADPILARLKSLSLVHVSVATYDTERTYARKGYRWDQLEQPVIPEATAIYRTPWLNGPFEIPDEGKERLAEKAKRGAETRDANKKAKAHAERLAAAVEALAARPLPFTAEDAAAFGQLMKDAGSGYPWTVEKGGGVSAKGKSYGCGINLYAVDASLVRLLVLAVNSAGAAGDRTEKPRKPAKSNGPLAGLIGDTLSQQIRAVQEETQ